MKEEEEMTQEEYSLALAEAEASYQKKRLDPGLNKRTKRKNMNETGHYYKPDGTPMHWVPKKDGTGTRPTTVSDAKKLGLLPSPTTILKVLSKPALTEWLVRQAILAFATAPDVPGETLDAKLTRVLDTERQQDQESTIAKDLGADIHAAIECALTPGEWDHSLYAHVNPAVATVLALGRVTATEKVLVGVGCAGKTDCLTENEEIIRVVDFKTTKKLPAKGAWPEHRMQAAFYAHALGNTGNKRVGCAIIYISTTEPGQTATFTIADWPEDYRKFRLLQDFWYLQNGIEITY